MSRRIAGTALLVAAAMWLPGGFAGPAPARAEGMGAPGVLAGPHRPLQVQPPRASIAPDHDGSPATDLFMGLLGFYRTVISAVDGDRCSMAPTCSIYSHQALRERGVLVGVLLTADRLIHEASSPAYAPRIRIDGETYFLDTLEDNTYWLDD